VCLDLDDGSHNLFLFPRYSFCKEETVRREGVGRADKIIYRQECGTRPDLSSFSSFSSFSSLSLLECVGFQGMSSSSAMIQLLSFFLLLSLELVLLHLKESFFAQFVVLCSWPFVWTG